MSDQASLPGDDDYDMSEARYSEEELQEDAQNTQDAERSGGDEATDRTPADRTEIGGQEDAARAEGPGSEDYRLWRQAAVLFAVNIRGREGTKPSDDDIHQAFEYLRGNAQMRQRFGWMFGGGVPVDPRELIRNLGGEPNPNEASTRARDEQTLADNNVVMTPDTPEGKWQRVARGFIATFMKEEPSQSQIDEALSLLRGSKRKDGSWSGGIAGDVDEALRSLEKR